jgi:hypothetical protein
VLTDTAQLIEEMHWQQPSAEPHAEQASLFPPATQGPGLTENERSLLQLFDEKKTLSLTDMLSQSRQDAGTLAITLLNLELLGHISSLPGKMYRCCV